MLLLVDAGNTRVKWALALEDAAPGEWLSQGAVQHGGLDAAGAGWIEAGRIETVTRAIVSNVAGLEMRARLSSLLGPIDTEWFASSASRAGLVNGYREPERLGCDRFAAAIGARALLPGQALVVATCGTATTIDAVDADGRFVGGMILPGLALMAGALARNTAQLPQAVLDSNPDHTPDTSPDSAPPPLFADNTNDAIVSGCLSAQAGAIERAVASHSQGSGQGMAACIVSGGAAPSVAPALKVAHRMVDNIVLVGLHAVLLAGTQRKRGGSSVGDKVGDKA